jgi:LAO/AO transport system kinase
LRLPELGERLRAGEPAAVAEALNLIDDERPERRAEARALLRDLASERRLAPTPRVGITGAPGAGKSSLLDALVRVWRARGERVGILAVDPSSRRSGGALLGDRARVRSSSGDSGVFFRSMAARSRLGGLADATWASVHVLASAFPRVVVETVGVGQSEADVIDLTDTLLFVAQPGAGDTLQFMKAGVLELPDVFAVNKSDVGAHAERTARELEAAVALTARDANAWRAPVLLCSARDGAGIKALVERIDAHFEHQQGGALARRRRSGDITLILDSLHRRYGSYGLERVGGTDALRARFEAAEIDTSCFTCLEALEGEIEAALGAGA